MKKWPPNTAGSGNEIRRNHSPFCESTGPIVQEGFVAARIRVLQELQAQALVGNRSHSPMTACPPNWIRFYEPCSPPKLDSAPTLPEFDPARSETEKPIQHPGRKDQKHMAGSKKVSSRADNSTTVLKYQGPKDEKSSCKPDPLRESSTRRVEEANTSVEMANDSKDAEVPVHNLPAKTAASVDTGTARLPYLNVSGRSEIEILGPYPISSSLANSSAMPNCSPQACLWESEHGPSYEHSQTRVLPRKSVADYLGSLVEHGWVAGNTLSKAAYRSHASKSMSTTAYLQNHRAGSPTPSVRDEPQTSKPSTYHNSLDSTATPLNNHDHGSTKQGSSPGSHSNLRPLVDLNPLQRREVVGEHRYQSPKNLFFERSSFDIGSHTLKSPVFSSIRSRRTYSLNNVHHFEKSNVESIELHGFSRNDITNGQYNNRRSISASVSSYKSGSPQSTDEGGKPKSNKCRSPSQSSLPRSRSSRSSNVNIHSNSPKPRSTSWFKKSWLNPFSGDRQQAIGIYPKESLSSTCSSGQTDGTQQNFVLSPEQLSRARSTVSSVDEHDHEGRARISRIAQRAQNENTILASLQQHSPKYAESCSGQSQASTTSKPVPVPARRSSKRAPTSPPKAASLAPMDASDNLLLPHKESVSKPQRSHSGSHSRKPSTPPTPISVQGGQTGLHSSTRSKPAREGQMPSSREDSLPSLASMDHGQRKSRERGARIKKIQIVISFDGADDLIIEAATTREGEHGARPAHELDSVQAI